MHFFNIYFNNNFFRSCFLVTFTMLNDNMMETTSQKRYKEKMTKLREIPNIEKFWRSIKSKSFDLKLQHEIESTQDDTGEYCHIWFPDKTCIEIGYYWYDIPEIKDDEHDFIYDDERHEPYTCWFCRNITDPDSKDYLNRLDWCDTYNKIIKNNN